eukprot:NODE_430_length_8744_cov_0.579988.p4 type:complete len:212 gc:universal NODE_430_length_8744_cov_0.579988:1681-1046(-)
MQKSFVYELLRKAVFIESMALDKLKSELRPFKPSHNIFSDLSKLKEIEGYYSGYFKGIQDMQLLHITQLKDQVPNLVFRIPKIDYSSNSSLVQEELNKFEKERILWFQYSAALIFIFILYGIHVRLKHGEKWHQQESIRNTLTLFTCCSAIGLLSFGVKYRLIKHRSNKYCRKFIDTANDKLLTQIELIRSQSPLQKARLEIFKELENENK